MLDKKEFWYGVGAGVLVVGLYHHFVKPLPSRKTK